MEAIHQLLLHINPRTISTLFLFFLFTKIVIELYLEFRNYNHIKIHQDKVPGKFSDKITLEDHQKAANYSTTKISRGLIFYFLNIFILLTWTLGGGFDLIDVYAKGFGYGDIATGLIFFGFYAIISMIIGLPESLINTFITEEQFGFNKTTPKTFILDMIKGIILGVIIGAPIIAGILYIMKELGTYWWAYAWAFLTLIQLTLLLVYPNFIAPLFNKFSPLEDGDIKDKVVSLLKKVQFSHEELFVMDASKRSSHGNAYFTGFGKKKRIVLFDTLLKNLTPLEVEAVLAHELGHFKKKHVMKMLIKTILFSLFGFFVLGTLYQLPSFFIGHGLTQISIHGALALFATISSIYTFFLTPIGAWSSRKNEFEADAFASEYAQANELISALVKLYKDNASTLTPDPIYSAYYHSHPPALIRVQHLESLAKE